MKKINVKTLSLTKLDGDLPSNIFLNRFIFVCEDY